MHMVDHITTHHRDVLKMNESKGKASSYMDDPYSSDKYLQSFHDDFPPPSINHHQTSKPVVVADKFLSFLNSPLLPKQTKPVQVDSSVQDKTLIEDSSTVKDRTSSTPPLSDTEQLEKANKCEFVQGLLSSAMFDEGCDFF